MFDSFEKFWKNCSDANKEWWGKFASDMKQTPEQFKNFWKELYEGQKEIWSKNIKDIEEYREKKGLANLPFDILKACVTAPRDTNAMTRDVADQMNYAWNWYLNHEQAKQAIIKAETEKSKKENEKLREAIRNAKTPEEKAALEKQLREKEGKDAHDLADRLLEADLNLHDYDDNTKTPKKHKNAELKKIPNKKLGGNPENPLVPYYKVAKVPPSYYDDVLPSHRDAQGMYFLRIGDCQFFIPPLFINVTNDTPTQKMPTIRQKESISIKSGYNNRTITVTLWFGGLEQINGLKMDGPGGQSYYMDGLRSLIAQFKRAPFVPIVNELLNSVYGIYAGTLFNISVSTVPEFPQNLQVTLVLKEFNAQPYIGMPTPILHRMYCWPIFRWYYQQMLTDDPGACARTKLPKIQTSHMSNRIRFKMLPTNILNAKRPEKPGGAPTIHDDQLQFLDNEYIWMEELPMHYDDFVVTGINVSLSNIISNVQMAYYQSPTCQYMGSLDTLITIDIQTKSRIALTELIKMHDTTQEYSRRYKDKILCGYIGIDNELINMFGVETATIEGIDTSTVEGFPGLFNVTIRIISYNKTQKRDESPTALAPHRVLGDAINKIGQIGKDKFNFKNPMILDGVLEDMIKEIEVYPDLELPTYGQLRTAVKNINAYRTAHGLSSIGITDKDIITPFDKVYDAVIQEAKTIDKGSKKDRIDVVKYPGNSNAITGKNLDLLQTRLLQYADNKRGLRTITSKQPKFNKTLQNAVKTFTGNLGLSPCTNGVSQVAWNAIVNVNWNVSEHFPENYTIIKQGKKNSINNANVTKVQKALEKMKYLKTGSYSTGTYDSATANAVRKFQADSGFLYQDSIVGVNTWGEIFAKLKQMTETIPEVKETKEEEDSVYVDPDFYVFYPTPSVLGITNSDIYQKSIDALKDGSSNKMLDKRLKSATTPQQINDNILVIAKRASELGQDYGVSAKDIVDKDTIDMPKIDPDNYYKMMLHDMYAYNKRNTLTRAFPTTLFLFVDEGQRVSGVRLWSNMYAYHAIVSVSVTNDIDTPASTCELILANMYHTLDTNPSYAPIKKKGFFEQQFLQVDPRMLEARKRIYDHMALSPGCRIHVRMGYGSAPQGLPTVFNGVITEMDTGDVMTIIGQGDGVELCNPMPEYNEKSSNGMFDQGSEPSNIIRNIMSARTDFQASYVWDDSIPRFFNKLFGDKDNEISCTVSKYGGFANGSKYGIEHFGYTFVDDDQSWIEKNFKAFFHIGDQGRWCYDICKNVYKGHPYYDEEGDYAKTTDINDDGIFKQDERNVYMYLYGKSPWDVCKTLSGCSSEFVAATKPHNFRSTLFFGQPFWLYKYGYRYIGGNKLADRENLSYYYDLVKTFQQAHLIDSFNDIIDNQMIANAEGVITAVIPTYVEGNDNSDVKTDMLIYADKNIYPECQKTAYYDTTMMQNFPGFDSFWRTCGFANARENARTMGLQYLQHSFRNMYKGEVIILGDPAISPYDFIYLTDSYVKMSGPCQAGRVTHFMSINDGFITTFKPDLISITKEAGSVNYAKVLSALQYYCYNAFTSKMMMQTATTLQEAEKVFKIEERRNLAEKIENGKLLADIASAIIIPLIISYPLNLLAIVFIGVAWNYIDEFGEWLLNVFSGRNDHGITVIPIYYKDKPYIIGVKGYKELIPFQEDPALDGETSLIQGSDMDEATMEEYAKNVQAEYQATQTNLFGRNETGIDMFNIVSTNRQQIDYVTAYKYGGIGGNDYFGAASDIRAKIIAEAWRIVNLCKNSGMARYSQDTNLRGRKVNGIEWYDCSAFAQHCYKFAGLSIGPTTGPQYAECHAAGAMYFTDDSKAIPGDLVFYGKGGCSHVGIYIGDGKILNASTARYAPNKQIKEANVHGRSDFLCYGRPKALVDADKAAGGGGGGHIVLANCDAGFDPVKQKFNKDQKNMESFGTTQGKSTVANMNKYGYKNTLLKICKEEKIDPYVVLAMIATESDGKPNAQTGSYKGLMQTKASKDVATNIRAGIKELKGYASMIHSNNPIYLLYSYNAGPDTMNKVLKIYQKTHPGATFDNTPGGELAPLVRDYVKKHHPSWSSSEKYLYHARVTYVYRYLKANKVLG